MRDEHIEDDFDSRSWEEKNASNEPFDISTKASLYSYFLCDQF